MANFRIIETDTGDSIGLTQEQFNYLKKSVRYSLGKATLQNRPVATDLYYNLHEALCQLAD